MPKYNFPSQVQILNKKVNVDAGATPQFQLHENSKIILLENVSIGPHVTIAAGPNAQISIEESRLENCMIVAWENSSIYLRNCKINQAIVRSSHQHLRMMLEYLRLTDSTILNSCPLVSGKRHGNNRELHLADCSFTGAFTLKGHGRMSHMKATIEHPRAITLHHGYADKSVPELNPINIIPELSLADLALGAPPVDQN